MEEVNYIEAAQIIGCAPSTWQQRLSYRPEAMRIAPPQQRFKRGDRKWRKDDLYELKEYWQQRAAA